MDPVPGQPLWKIIASFAALAGEIPEPVIISTANLGREIAPIDHAAPDNAGLCHGDAHVHQEVPEGPVDPGGKNITAPSACIRVGRGQIDAAVLVDYVMVGEGYNEAGVVNQNRNQFVQE